MFGPSSNSFAAPGSGFGFGTTSKGFGTAAAPATGGFGFGTAPAAAPTTGFGSGFGAFGTQSNAGAPANNVFGGFGFGQNTAAPAAAPATTNLFGASAPVGGAFGNAFGQQPTQQQRDALAQQQAAQQVAFQAQYAHSIEARVSAIQSAYSPQSPDCRFQTVFYNKVEPQTIAQYVKPAIANARLWDAAVKSNPDPSTLVPSLAIGFDDLRKRISEQDKAAAAFKTTLESMSKSLESMVHGHEASTASALVQLQRVHAQQSHRLLQLVNRVECARARDLPRVPQELEYDHKLQVLERKISQPQPLADKIAELAAMVKLMEQKNEGATTASGALAMEDSTGGGAAWLHPDDPSAQQLFTFLQTQRVALEYVTQMTKEDQRDLQTIQQVITQAQTQM